MAIERFGTGTREASDSPDPYHPEVVVHQSRPLDAQVRDILSKEGIEAPPIQVHVALIVHDSAKAAESLRDEIRACDVYIPEGSGWTPEEAARLNALSQGELTPRQAREGRTQRPFPEFNDALEKIIYKSGKKVRFVDLPYGHPIQRTDDYSSPLYSAELEERRIREDVPSAPWSFEKAVSEAIAGAEFVGRIRAARDQYMLDQLPAVIAEAIRSDPELQRPRRKGPLRVFMHLGANHLLVPGMLEKGGTSVSTRTADKGRYLTVLNQASTKVKTGETLSVDDGERIVVSIVLSRLYEYAHASDRKIFKELDDRFGPAVVEDILTGVFSDMAEKIYTDFKGAHFSTTSENKCPPFFPDYFHTLLQSRKDQVERKIAELEKDSRG